MLEPRCLDDMIDYHRDGWGVEYYEVNGQGFFRTREEAVEHARELRPDLPEEAPRLRTGRVE